MKHAALAIAFAFGLVACERASSTVTSVTVPWPAAHVGDRETEVREESFTQVSSDGREVTGHEKIAMRWEILAIADGVATKIKLTFDEIERPTDDAAAVPGKVYVLSVTNGHFEATDAGGESLPAREMEAIAEEWKHRLGVKSGLGLVLTRRTWRLGEHIHLTREDRANLEIAPDANVSFVLSAIDGDLATFAFDETDDDGVNTMSGHATFAIDIQGGHRLVQRLTQTIAGNVNGSAEIRGEWSRVPASPAARD